MFSGNGNAPHPRLHQRQKLLFLALHLIDRDRGELGGVVVGVLQNREAAEDFAALQDLAADGADHMFEAELVRIGVITLGAGEFAEADRHHLEEAAFDFAREIGVPFDAADQENAGGIEGVAIHEGLDSIRRAAERNHVERTDDRASHGGFVDSEMIEHGGLAFGVRGSVAAHGGEEERLEAARFPEIDDVADDGGEVGDASAADADGDARSGREIGAEVGGGQLAGDGRGDVVKLVVGEILADGEEAGEGHNGIIPNGLVLCNGANLLKNLHATRLILGETAMNLTIKLPDEDVQVLEAKATARGVSAEEYALQVIERDLAPEWLRESWTDAKETGLDRLSMDEIDAEITAARQFRREIRPQLGS